jgi:hypothetical protein
MKQMIRNNKVFILLTTLTTALSLHAEPSPSADSASSKKADNSQTSQSRTNALPKSVSAPVSGEGWNFVKGELILSDGYKYVNGQVIRTGANTHKRPPKPPSKSLLNSVKSKPTPTPDPNSAAAKAAEKERNLRPRPASQTGTHL